MILRIERMAYLRAPAVERTGHADGWKIAVRRPVVLDVKQLEPRFVDDLGTQNGGLGGLHGVVCIQTVRASIQQVQVTDSGSLAIIPREAITKRKRVVGIDLIIQARADAQTGLGRKEDAIERRDG